MEGEKFKRLLLKGEVSKEDFRRLYPGQSDNSLVRTANYYMKPLEGLGLAVKENGKWRVRKDILKVVEEFERLRKKTGFEGDLFEFIAVVFRRTRDLLKRKSFIEVLAQEHGVREEALMKFIEEFLDSVEWKTEKDLERFTEELRKGLWIKINPELYSEIKGENREEIRKLKDSGMTEEMAVMAVINKLLLLSVPSLELWEDIREDAGEQGTYAWLVNRLAERKRIEGVELVPVSKRLWDGFQKEASDLRDNQREALKTRLMKRLNDAIEKTIRDAKNMKRKKK